MPVGDVNSNERGSGARFNDGKPDLSLIPPILLPYADPEQRQLQLALQSLMFEGKVSMLKDFYYDTLHATDCTAVTAKVFEYGKKKYAAWNWAKGMAWSVPVACALRHADALWYRGEELDAESGLPHLGHLMCNLVMLLHFVQYYPDLNDLPYKVLNNAGND
jgi:hypothetical protein